MILLWRFYDSVGVYYYYSSGLRGPTDEEIIVIEKTVSYSKFPEGGGMLYQQSHTGKQQGLAWRQREGGGSVRSSCHCGACRTEWVRKGR